MPSQIGKDKRALACRRQPKLPASQYSSHFRQPLSRSFPTCFLREAGPCVLPCCFLHASLPKRPGLCKCSSSTEYLHGATEARIRRRDGPEHFAGAGNNDSWDNKPATIFRFVMHLYSSV